MYRGVLMAVTAALLCLAADVRPLLAAKVQSGAMDICRLFDGGKYEVTADGTEVCCANERRGEEEEGEGTGKFYCVQCDSAGSNDCEMWTEAGTPSDHINTILLGVIRSQQEGILVEQHGIRASLNEILAGLGKLQTSIDALEDGCHRTSSP